MSTPRHRDSPQRWRPQFLSHSPMFASLRPAGALLEASEQWPAVAQYQSLLRPRASLLTSSRLSVRFAPPESCATPKGYEQRVSEDGVVETRERNWHDLFNALVWATFPLAKSALNAAHVRELAAPRPGMNRTRAQDVLTLFDENGAVIASADARLLALLHDHQWQQIFWRRRSETQAQMRFFLFGHGLCEKVFAPYLGLTAKALVFVVDAAFLTAPLSDQLAALDQLLAQRFADAGHLTSTRVLTPLPVLGVPDWWPANNCASFYENESYFRPKSVRVLAAKN